MKYMLLVMVLCIISPITFAQNIEEPIASGLVLEQSDSLRRIDQDEAALKILELIHPSDSNYIDALLKKSSTLGTLERYDEAIQVCEDALKQDVNGKEHFFKLNIAYFQDLKGEKDKALKNYQNLVKENPFFRLAQNNLSRQYLKNEKFDSSYQAYKDFALKFPFDENAHFNLGVFAFNEGHFTEAFMALNLVILLSPNSETAYNVLNFLNELSNNVQIEKEPKKGLKFESEEYKDIDLLIENYLALKKEYKVDADFSIYVIKQNHLIFSQLLEKNPSDYFFSSYYGPLYRKLMKEDKFKDFANFILIPSKNDKHKAQIAKKIADLKEFNSWFIDTWYDEHFRLELKHPKYKGTYKAYYYNNADIESFAEYNFDKDEKQGMQYYLLLDGGISAQGKNQNNLKTGLWEYYYPSGNIKQKVNYSEGNIKGEALIFYETGGIKESLNFENELREGPFKEYYESGAVQKDGNYSEGKYDGDINYYYVNGQIEYKTIYDKGKLNGVLEQYYANNDVYRKQAYAAGEMQGVYQLFWPGGNKRYFGSYDNGELNGPIKDYYFNEQIEVEGNFDKGNYDGTWVSYYKDGSIDTKIEYKNGDYNGLYQTYDRAGVLRIERLYKDDYLLNYKNFDADGKLIDEGGDKKKAFEFTKYHLNGKKAIQGKYKFEEGEIGEWKYYDVYGNLETIIPFSKGVKEGVQEDFYPWGQLKKKVNYTDGSAEGYYEEYFGNGAMEEEGYYKGNNLEGTWRVYYLDGTLEEESYHSSDELDGWEYNYAVDGKLSHKVKYEDGVEYQAEYYDTTGNILSQFNWPQKQGIYEINYLNGAKKFRGKYILGKPDSMFVWYDPDGKVESKGMYKNGTQQETWTWYHENGQVSYEGNFLNGKKHGDWKRYFEDGTPEELTHFVYGVQEKKEFDYFENGKVSQEIPYVNDQKHGNQLFYDISGEFQLGRTYNRGELVSYFYLGESGDTIRKPVIDGTVKIQAKYKNGAPSREMELKKGFFQGDYKVYYFNGQMAREYTLVNDEWEGVYKEYHPNGKLKEKGNYSYGTRDGVQEEYYENGQLKRKFNMKNGDKHGEELKYAEDGKLLSSDFYYNGVFYEN